MVSVESPAVYVVYVPFDLRAGKNDGTFQLVPSAYISNIGTFR